MTNSKQAPEDAYNKNIGDSTGKADEKQKGLHQLSGVGKEKIVIEKDLNKTKREKITNTIKAYPKLLNRMVRNFFSGTDDSE
jgi:hypothetical protein